MWIKLMLSIVVTGIQLCESSHHSFFLDKGSQPSLKINSMNNEFQDQVQSARTKSEKGIWTLSCL